jgi:hypothetical protein|tara:strand:- start:315 stop:902 length:588 start_codon:yes stop_codon:yes gene_type:complete
MKNLTLLEIYNNNWDGPIPGNNDKGSNHSYIEIYERLLSPYRDTNCKILEIGVAQGYSLRMWNQYFNKNSKVQGIDWEKGNLCDNTLDVTYGDSKDADLWTDWDNFDVIIDDGDHSPEGQAATLAVWLPKLTKNGLYIIEDVSLYNLNMVATDLGIVLQRIGCLNYVIDILDMRQIKQRNDNVLLVFSKQGLEEL